MKKDTLYSILIPAFSILIIALAYFFLDPGITGLAVYNPEQASKLINADIKFSTKEGEVLPPNAIIEVHLDNRKASMTVHEFITKTKKQFRIETGSLEDFGFYGPGFTGDYTYNLTLADFPIDRNVNNGEHIFKTRISYRSYTLYEKENRIMIN
jgi:hypothetical protein